jgi:hypothetical protein
MLLVIHVYFAYKKLVSENLTVFLLQVYALQIAINILLRFVLNFVVWGHAENMQTWSLLLDKGIKGTFVVPTIYKSRVNDNVEYPAIFVSSQANSVTRESRLVSSSTA